MTVNPGITTWNSSAHTLFLRFSSAVQAGTIAASQLVVHGSDGHAWGSVPGTYPGGTSFTLNFTDLGAVAHAAPTLDYTAPAYTFVGNNGNAVLPFTDLVISEI